MNWLIKNWYILWSLVSLVIIYFIALHFRKNQNSKAARLFFTLLPFTDPTISDPNSKNPFRLTPRAVIIMAAGIVIILFVLIIQALIKVL
jgi:hypothetical protein